MLRAVTRSGDFVARLGGDEFALLVFGASEPALVELSQRIVEAMRHAELDLAPPGYRLTASVGFAILDGDETDVDELLDAADLQMRGAKKGGKDRWSGRFSAEQAAGLRAVARPST